MSDWRPIPGYEGYYEAHPDGLIRSVDRVVPEPRGSRRLRGRVLRQATGTDGYLFVTLTVLAKPQNERVAYLVCRTFRGPRPKGKYVCHRDDIRTNNKLENLRYGTPKQNHDDMVANGMKVRGEKVKTAKLTEDDVRYIRKNPAGLRHIDLAEQFGVVRQYIGEIVHRRRWRHVL